VEIIIIRKAENKHDSPMLTWLNQQFIPNGIIATINGNLQLEQLQKYPFFMNRIPSSKEEKGESIEECALVCRNFTCSLPIYSIQDLELHIADTHSS
jgi:hypothetical protein